MIAHNHTPKSTTTPTTGGHSVGLSRCPWSQWEVPRSGSSMVYLVWSSMSLVFKVKNSCSDRTPDSLS
jgi:hypothetical protein